MAASIDMSRFIREPAEDYLLKASDYLTFGQVKYHRTVARHWRKILRDCAERGITPPAIPLATHSSKTRLPGLQRFGPQMIDSDELIAKAFHCLLLMGSRAFTRHYRVGGPINFATGKPYGHDTKAYRIWQIKEQRKALSRGDLDNRECISWTQYHTILKMLAAVQANPEALALLADGIGEGILRAKYAGTDCQVRLDWYNPEVNAIVDLKTSFNLGTTIDNKAWDRAVYAQGAFHQQVFAAAMDSRPPPVWIVIAERRWSARVEVFELDQWRLDKERWENEAAIREFLGA